MSDFFTGYPLLHIYPANQAETMPETEFVLLESSDGYTFVVPRHVACASGMLKSMLDEESGSFFTFVDGRNEWGTDSSVAAFEESKSGACKIQQRFVMGTESTDLYVALQPLIYDRGVILLKVLEYLAYKVQYADFNAADITEDFSTRIDPYIALELSVPLHLSSRYTGFELTRPG